MTESETIVATPAIAAPKKKKTPVKAKSATKKTASHPPTAQMVNNAIKTLNDRGGSSLIAIKKSISSTYKVDTDKFAPFIKKYLKSAVDSGVLIRTKGVGAAGSFKLASKTEPKKKTKTTTALKKKPASKKEVKPKKAKVTPKKATKKKSVTKLKAVSKPKTTPTTPKKAPSKVKKTKATPTKKPKKVAAKKPKKIVTKK